MLIHTFPTTYGLGWDNKQKEKKKKNHTGYLSLENRLCQYSVFLYKTASASSRGSKVNTMFKTERGHTNKSKGACRAFSDFPTCAQWETSSDEKRLEIFILKISESFKKVFSNLTFFYHLRKGEKKKNNTIGSNGNLLKKEGDRELIVKTRKENTSLRVSLWIATVQGMWSSKEKFERR